MKFQFQLLYLVIISQLWRINSIDQSLVPYSRSNTSNFPKIGIVCMQKNEEDILPYWLEYHSNLVGIKNIVILDGFSNNSTLELLETWEQEKGLRILYRQGPYEQKGMLTIHAFRSCWTHLDIAIPLDADEFLIGFRGSVPTFSKSVIISYLQEFWRNETYGCLSLPQSFVSLNTNLNETVHTVNLFEKKISELGMAKKIAKLKYLVELHHGNHKVLLRGIRKECQPAWNHLGLFHYHYRNALLTAKRAFNDVSGFGYLSSSVTFENVKQQEAQIAHLVDVSPGDTKGLHKIIELLKYVRDGPTSLLRSLNNIQIERIGTLSEILRNQSMQ